MTAPITDLSLLPVVLTLDEIAAVYRRGKATIRRELQEKTFRPEPFARFPYRWLRSDIEKDLQRRSAVQSTRRGRRRSA